MRRGKGTAAEGGPPLPLRAPVRVRRGEGPRCWREHVVFGQVLRTLQEGPVLGLWERNRVQGARQTLAVTPAAVLGRCAVCPARPRSRSALLAPCPDPVLGPSASQLPASGMHLLPCLHSLPHHHRWGPQCLRRGPRTGLAPRHTNRRDLSDSSPRPAPAGCSLKWWRWVAGRSP